jgi:hypothetical protein
VSSVIHWRRWILAQKAATTCGRSANGRPPLGVLFVARIRGGARVVRILTCPRIDDLLKPSGPSDFLLPDAESSGRAPPTA